MLPRLAPCHTNYRSLRFRCFHLPSHTINESIRRSFVLNITPLNKLDSVSRTRKRLCCLELMGPDIDIGRDDHPTCSKLSLNVISSFGHRLMMADGSNNFAECPWSNRRVFSERNRMANYMTSKPVRNRQQGAQRRNRSDARQFETTTQGNCLISRATNQTTCGR